MFGVQKVEDKAQQVFTKPRLQVIVGQFPCFLKLQNSIGKFFTVGIEGMVNKAS